MLEGVTKKGYGFLGVILGLYAAIIILFLTIPSPNTYNFLVRFFALTGFYCIAIATLMTPFVKEIYKEFGKPFMKIHHIFAAIGITGATLHPVIFAIQVSDIAVFLPDISSWIAFWELAGRPAFILVYIAVGAAILQRKIPKYWRAIHSMIYVVLIFVYFHAYLIGTDFDNLGILIIFTILFVASMGAFVFKRLQKMDIIS